MAIAFQCPRCQAEIQVPDENAGQKGRCPKCQAKVRVPAPTAPPPSVSKGVPGGSATPNLHVVGAAIDFSCPKCQSTIHVPGTSAGQKGYCPRCGTKVRVPRPETGAPPLASFAPLAIQFLCPRCEAPIHVSADAAGTKGFCPQCGGKVMVPVPESGAITSATPSAAPQPASRKTAAAPFADATQPAGPSMAKQFVHRQRARLTVWLFPLFCIVVLGGAGAYFLGIPLWKPTPKLEGTLTAEHLTDVELGPFKIDDEKIDLPRRFMIPVFRHLEEDPLRANSSLMEMDFIGTGRGIQLVVRPSDKTEFLRVDPRQDKLLAQFIADNAVRFEERRVKDLAKSLPDFIRAAERRRQSGKPLDDLLEFRNSVGIASLVKGFGHHVQAVLEQGKEKVVYPCLLEDRDGRLYFCLPNKTSSFELRGIDLPKDAPKETLHFPGAYKVEISKKLVTLRPEPEEPKKKRLNLFGDKPKYSEAEDGAKPDDSEGAMPEEGAQPRKKPSPKKR